MAETESPKPEGEEAPKADPKEEPAPERESEIKLSSKALQARLERERETERRKLLAELGVEKSDDAKQALTEWKTKREAEKSELQRLIDEKNKLSDDSKRANEYAEVIRERVEIELSHLTEPQRAAVEKLAKGDAAATLRAIDALRPTWLEAKKEPEKPGAPTEKKVAPVTTAPAGKPPAEAPSGSIDIQAQFKAMQEKNPFEAGQFLRTNLSKFPDR